MQLIDLIDSAVLATTFIGDHSFAWFGKCPAELPPKLRSRLTREARRQHLAATLADQLYRNFYCPGFARPIRWTNTGQAAADDFVAQLSAANTGTGSWSSGWLARSACQPRIVVAKEGLAVTTFISELHGKQDSVPEAGTTVSLRVPKDLRGVSPGFLVVVGNAPNFVERGQLLRLYWNIAAVGAAALVSEVTQRLNKADIAFRLKLLNNPAHYNRCDAAVLYIQRTDYDIVQSNIEEIYGAVRDHLGDLTPVFTRQLAPGLGLAEDPQRTESFGMQRCRLLAQGMLAARAASRASTAERRDEVLAEFTKAGISIERPHLNSGNEDQYRFAVPSTTRAPPGQGCDANMLNPEQVIELIASQLCRSALWYEDRCTWVSLSERNPENPALTTLGSDLYSGLSGIALFLAEAGQRMGGVDVIRTARGALRQAGIMLNEIPPPQRAGLYTGWTGVALALLHVGRCIGCGELLDQARRLARAAVSTARLAAGNDLLSGWAGTIVGVLQLAKGGIVDHQLATVSMRLGDRLIQCAERSNEGASWRTINRAGEYNLTGFSHGTAGIAYALIELFKACGEPRFINVARDALAYEQCWFDPARGNWPDLREARPHRMRRSATMDYSTYWCHGAPGIALSRIAAYRAMSDPGYLDQACIALRTTSNSLSPARNLTLNDLVLCHGTIGNADILLTGERELGRILPSRLIGARQVADGSGAAVNASVGRSLFPTEGAVLRQPGLMTGLAGAGWFYLRLIDATVPSVLRGIVVDEVSSA